MDKQKIFVYSYIYHDVDFMYAPVDIFIKILQNDTRELEARGFGEVCVKYCPIEDAIAVHGRRLETDAEHTLRIEDAEQRLLVPSWPKGISQATRERIEQVEYLRLKAKYEPNN